MQIKVTRIEDGPARVEVIDPSDGAVTHTADVNVGEQVVVNAEGCQSPADISVADVEAAPEPEAQSEAGEAGEQAEAPASEGQPQAGEAEGAEAPGEAEAGDAGNGNTISRGGDAGEQSA